MILERSTTATVLHSPSSEAERFLPEGPRTIVVDGRPALAWVNIQNSVDSEHGEVHLRFMDGEHRSYVQKRRPGFQFPTDRTNILLIGMEKEIGTLNLDTNHFTPLANIEDPNPRTIVNDGEVVPGGKAIVFGTKDIRFADAIAKLYLFTIDDCRLTLLADGQLCSNGKVFAQDDRGLLLYDIDTPHRNVVRHRLDVQARTITEPHEVLDLRNEPGFPDGMVDAGDGSVIVAFYNPEPIANGRAVRYDLMTGRAIEEWLTPGSPRVTCPMLFDNEGGIRLVLTTCTEGMADELRAKCPAAGDLFWADTKLNRLPTAEIVRLA